MLFDLFFPIVCAVRGRGVCSKKKRDSLENEIFSFNGLSCRMGWGVEEHESVAGKRGTMLKNEYHGYDTVKVSVPQTCLQLDEAEKRLRVKRQHKCSYL